MVPLVITEDHKAGSTTEIISVLCAKSFPISLLSNDTSIDQSCCFDRCFLQDQKLIFHSDLIACLKSVIKECLTCIQVKGKVVSTSLNHAPIPKVPFEVIHLDFIGPVPAGTQLNRYVLIIVDQLTRYIVVVPTQNRVTETVVLAQHP